MKIKIDSECNLSVNLFDLLEEAPDEKLPKLAVALAVQDPVIDAVVEQLLDGFTEDGSRGYVSVVAAASPSGAIERARRRIAAQAGEVAAREMRRLEEALRSAEEREARLQRRLHTAGL